MNATAAVAAVAIVAGAVFQFGAKREQKVAGDLLAAFLAACIVSPIAMIIDVAVTKSASGKSTVMRAIVSGVKEFLTKPLVMIMQPAFQLSLFVYVCTYAGANLTEVGCKLYLQIDPKLPKLVGSTLANMGACMVKDSKLAQLYGKTAESRPFPTIGYILFLARDILANGSGFTLPPMVAPLLESNFGESALTAAQLAVPAAMNLVTSPLHFLALSIYNNPKASAGQHAANVGATYVPATSVRILKGLAAFGLGGVSNTALRGRFGSA
jgi:hypothetical protein